MNALLTLALSALMLPVAAAPTDRAAEPARGAEVARDGGDDGTDVEGDYDDIEWGCDAHDESMVQVVDFAIGTGVERRVLTGAADRFPLDTARVYAHLTLQSPIETTVEVVWKRGDTEVQRLTLAVGASTRWRTWSYRTLRPRDAGRWSVEVYDADGAMLDLLAFDVVDPVAPTVSRR